MAINFGNKFNHQAPANYEQPSTPERITMPRTQAREFGHKTLNACYGNTSYSDLMRQLQAANDKLNSALDRANASAFSALNSVNHLK